MSKEMIDALANGDNLSAENEFKAAISQKVGDSLERKRVEVASTMNQPNRINQHQIETSISCKRVIPKKNPRKMLPESPI